jgi:hypothetical protein
VVDFNRTPQIWLSAKEPRSVGEIAEFFSPNPFVDFKAVLARGAI